MADNAKMVKATQVYESICSAMDAHEIKYTRHDDDLVITCGFAGDDLPMDFLFRVNADAEVVSLISPMSFKIAEDKRVDAALAVCIANYGLVNGAFDYDISDGEIRFRMVSSYRGETKLDGEVFFYMLLASNFTVDKYNDRFLMISKGMIDVQKFIEMENADN